MHDFKVVLTLTEDCIFSERQATEGGHKGLDYIPGAAILGMAAAQLYNSKTLSPEEVFTLFHSGKVRFGNGLPLANSGEATWPLPLCWHKAKGAEVKPDKILIQEHIWYGAKLQDKEAQPESLGKSYRYVSKSGTVFKPDKTMRMKTAINPATGIAMESALFGYDSLVAGQSFIAHIGIDADVSNNILKQVRELFSKPVLLLGRSRSAEYGRTKAKIQEASSSNISTSNHSEEQQVTLWLLSDLAALDDCGQPTLTPNPKRLGLPSGKLVPDSTFIRTRRYSSWNAYLGGPGLERQVISQGSVLVFDLSRPLNAEEYKRIAAGLGVYREAGLGQVWLNPDWLGKSGGHPHFIEAALPPKLEHKKSQSVQEPALIQWLKTGTSKQKSRGDLTKEARAKAKEYEKLLNSARKLKGLDKTIPIGPSASQWGSVLEAAKSIENKQGLETKLFNEKSGVCKSSMPGWKDEYWQEGSGSSGLKTFLCWIQNEFNKRSDGLETRFMQMLAREIISLIKQDKRNRTDQG